MKPDQPGEDPKFYRLAFPALSMWLADYKEITDAGRTYRATLTKHKPGAKFFAYPTMEMIESLREAFGRLEIEAVTFEEWIEQEGK